MFLYINKSLLSVDLRLRVQLYQPYVCNMSLKEKRVENAWTGFSWGLRFSMCG